MRLIHKGFFYSWSEQECLCKKCKSVFFVEEDDLKISAVQKEEGTVYRAYWVCDECLTRNNIALPSEIARIITEKRCIR